MTDGYGGITYTFGTIESAAGSIDSFIGYLNAELADIETKLRPLETEWTADAQQAYVACKTKWQQNAQDIVQVLGQLKTALSAAGVRMQEADDAAKRMFPGA
ncbi:MAG: WXG100 family type VII secretion target [Dactylosporangium sp.]|nr:WXG100 family type VII secretion target [Dactylosporangium sp.]NNJ63227.1 WXG100 family type VII secretion target [Dactylosporangium sp.]